MPILNRAKIQVMLSGHWHRHLLKKADHVRQFPIIVNSNVNTIQATVNAKEAVFKILDQQGKEVDKLVVLPQ